MINRLRGIIGELRDELVKLSEYIYENPELGFEEKLSSTAHINILEKYGFIIEKNYLGFDTAFRATYDSKKEGPTIAYLVEYDALPGIGHGCGHNILGTVSTGAGITLRKVIDKLGGRVVVLGSPAEETSGVKVDMALSGTFDDVDVAMMAHPSTRNERSGKSLSLLPIRFEFKGKTAHAASAPEKGINALDACILTFNNINTLREHLLESTRIHGIIREGGEAANVVPDRAVAEFYLRTPVSNYMEELKRKVINCAEAAALATGAEVEYSYYEKPYEGMITNQTLSKIYEDSLNAIGVTEIYDRAGIGGSLDMGNVSQVCPSIHPYFSIVEEGKDIHGHTREFADATLTEIAYKGMEETIFALAMTGVRVIEDEELLENIKKEFNESVI